jgi:hypothetical protein
MDDLKDQAGDCYIIFCFNVTITDFLFEDIISNTILSTDNWGLHMCFFSKLHGFGYEQATCISQYFIVSRCIILRTKFRASIILRILDFYQHLEGFGFFKCWNMSDRKLVLSINSWYLDHGAGRFTLSGASLPDVQFEPCSSRRFERMVSACGLILPIYTGGYINDESDDPDCKQKIRSWPQISLNHLGFSSTVLIFKVILT